jgi:hypothetical protein
MIMLLLFCITLHFHIPCIAPHALHHLALDSYIFVYVRSCGAEFEEPMVQAKVEAITNLVLDQGKPRCITPPSVTFIFE